MQCHSAFCFVAHVWRGCLNAVTGQTYAIMPVGALRLHARANFNFSVALLALDTISYQQDMQKR